MPKRPKYHKVISEKVNNLGLTVYTLRYNPELFANAKCRGIDTELFYPPRDKFSREEEQYFSERLCGGCPAREACLEWGMVHERHGIWGGLTAFRRDLKRRAFKWAFNDISLQSIYR